jgi:DNA-binding NtrC family response regulator
MSHLQVLVISTGTETGSWLAERLCPRRFSVSTARPGPGLIRAVRAGRPHVAVVEGIHTRPGMAQMEVALLKDQHPGIPIIAVSEQSSEFDAEVVELGIFCYLAGCSRDELLRVVEAAVVERESGARHAQAEALPGEARGGPRRRGNDPR